MGFRVRVRAGVTVDSCRLGSGSGLGSGLGLGLRVWVRVISNGLEALFMGIDRYFTVFMI